MDKCNECLADAHWFAGGSVEDGSWSVKKANCLYVRTEHGKKEFFVCDNSEEHKQWLDALFYATTVSKLAEYCSPLSGGWLHFLDVRHPQSHIMIMS
jgi:hypothetical protein